MFELYLKLGTRRLSNRSFHMICKLLGLAVVALLIFWHATQTRSGTSPFLHPALQDPELTGSGSADELAPEVYRKYKFDISPSWLDSYTLRKNLLQVRKGPRRGTSLDSIDDLYFYDSDPRLSWTTYLDYFLRSELESADEIQFSWYDWADFRGFNKLLSLESTSVNCRLLYEKVFDLEYLNQAEEEIGDLLFISERARYNDSAWYAKQKPKRREEDCPPSDLDGLCHTVAREKFQLPIDVLQLHEGVRPEVFDLQARTHLLSHGPQPLSLSILEHDTACYQLGVQKDGRGNIVQSDVLSAYLEAHKSEVDKDGDIQFDHLTTFERFLSSSVGANLRIKIPDVDRNVLEQNSVPLSPDDFEVDVRPIIQDLAALREKNRLSKHELNYLASLEYSIQIPPSLARKYFPEAPRVKMFEGMGDHRDQRFFLGALIWDPDEYHSRLNSLIRNWLKFARANGLITWIAHGSAYGYLYNGQRFPWDNDFDVQMPIRHLHLLSRYFNQSVVLEDPREGNGRFFIDVGNTITIRSRGNARNNIDARFIDVDSGLYVDITGLSVSSTPISEKLTPLFAEKVDMIDIETELRAFNSPERGEGLAAFTASELAEYVTSHRDNFEEYQIKDIIDAKQEEIDIQKQESVLQYGRTPEERYIINRELRIYNCRNNHFSSLDMLSPLQNTLFHGVPALLPRQNLVVLRNEYTVPSEYGFQVFEGKSFVPALHSWFTYNSVKDIAKMNSRYPELQGLKSPISNLEVEDIETILKNMLQLGLTELLAIQYMAFDAAAYRVKEIEIQYDDTIERDERQHLLHTLRTQVGPKVTSPGKDPLLFSYESDIWRELVLHLGDERSQVVQSAVQQDVLQQLWHRNLEIHEQKLPLFEVHNASGELVEDLNTSGKTLSHTNTIFNADPDD